MRSAGFPGLRWAALMLLCLLPVTEAEALSVGKARVESYIGEPLRISVPVQAEQLDGLRVRLLPADAAQSSFAQVLDASGFRVFVDRQTTPALIRIHGMKPLVEPVLQLMLQLTQNDSSMAFELNVLLDPRPAKAGQPVSTRRSPDTSPPPARRESRLQSTQPVVSKPVARSTKQPAPAAAPPERRRTMGPNTQAVFLKPGLFALQTRFDSYRQQQASAAVGVAEVQAGEPERFQSDWVLSGAALPGIENEASEGSAQPSVGAARLAESATQSPSPEVKRPDSAPVREIEQTLPQRPQIIPQVARPMPMAQRTVTPASEQPTDAVAAADDATAAKSSQRWMLWLALLVIGGYWLWRRRANRDVIHADFQAVPEERIPEIIVPKTPAAMAVKRVDFSAPPPGTSEGAKLREKIRHLRASGKLTAEQSKELQLAEIMADNDRLKAAKTILDAIKA